MNIETGVVGIVCTFLGGILGKLIDYKFKNREQNVTEQEFLFGKYRQWISDLEEKFRGIESKTEIVQAEYALQREENVLLREEKKFLRKESDEWKDRCKAVTLELNALKAKVSAP